MEHQVKGLNQFEEEEEKRDRLQWEFLTSCKKGKGGELRQTSVRVKPKAVGSFSRGGGSRFSDMVLGGGRSVHRLQLQVSWRSRPCFIVKLGFSDCSLRRQEEGELAKSTDHLKELEASFRGTLKVNAARKAKHTAISEAISTMVVRIEHLQRTVDDQREKKNKYEAVLSQQLLALQRIEEKNENVLETKKIQDMTDWYKCVLGFKIEGGEGVKFSFNKIDPNDQDKEYYFVIRLDGDVYILLHCNPQLDNIDELVEELNRTNGLFKFVRVMREKFKETTCKDSHSTAVLSPSLNSTESQTEMFIQDEPLSQSKSRCLGSVHKDVRTKVAIRSPHSISKFRRSPRFMVKKLP